MENKYLLMHILDVHTAAPFKDLFTIKPSVLADITAAMKKNGYDNAFPLILWAGHGGVLVDGHTRLQAAKDAGVLDVAVVMHDFADEEEALEYAITCQHHRRNLTDAELLSCLSALDKRKNIGRPKKNPSREGVSGESAEKTAKLLNISRAKVERLRTVKDHGSEKTKAAVAAGEMTINKAYNETMRDRRAQRVQEAPEKSPAEVRAERITAMIGAITPKVRIVLENEVRAFPELRYTAQERNRFDEALCGAISNLIGEMIPCETEETEE